MIARTQSDIDATVARLLEVGAQDAVGLRADITKAENLGLGLVVLGLLPQAGSLRGGLKLVCVWLLVLLAGATVSQLIARAALASEASGQRGKVK